MYGFFQHQYNYFDNMFTDGTPNFPASSISVNGGVAEEFISDRFNATRWLTIIAGIRGSQFPGGSLQRIRLTRGWVLPLGSHG